MSKSLGNFYTLRDLLNKGFTGTQVRYLLLQTHYKTQLNFTFQGLEGVKSALQRLQDFIERLQTIEQTQEGGKLEAIIHTRLLQFTQSLADDLNISAALSAVFDFVREVNSLCDAQQISQKEAQEALKLMRTFDSILGVLSFDKPSESIPIELEEALQKRIQARKDKNWQDADKWRNFIQERGFVIEDTPQGSRLKKL
jgi:cysteinyl-tRNA synthetase